MSDVVPDLRTEAPGPAFSGVCVGGPADGQLTSHPEPSFYVEVRGTLADAPPGYIVDPGATMEARRSFYEWVQITHYLGAWLHESARREGVGHAEAVLERLLRRYSELGGELG